MGEGNSGLIYSFIIVGLVGVSEYFLSDNIV